LNASCRIRTCGPLL